MKKLFFLFLLVACQKPNTNPPIQPQPTPTPTKVERTIKVIVTNGWGNIEVNNKITDNPCKAIVGDTIHLKYSGQPTTPQDYNMYLYVYIDNLVFDQCIGCYQYEKTFVLK